MIDAPSSKMAWAVLFLFASAQTPATAAKKFTDQQRRYWAFQKVTKPVVPAVQDESTLSPRPQGGPIGLLG